MSSNASIEISGNGAIIMINGNPMGSGKMLLVEGKTVFSAIISEPVTSAQASELDHLIEKAGELITDSFGSKPVDGRILVSLIGEQLDGFHVQYLSVMPNIREDEFGHLEFEGERITDDAGARKAFRKIREFMFREFPAQSQHYPRHTRREKMADALSYASHEARLEGKLQSSAFEQMGKIAAAFPGANFSL